MFTSIKNSDLIMELKDSSLGDILEDNIGWTVYLNIITRTTKDIDKVDNYYINNKLDIQDDILEEFKQIIKKYKPDIIKELNVELESNLEVIVEFYTENIDLCYFIVII